MTVVVALGSNLGDRLGHLRLGVSHLPEVVAVSRVYETEPVGGPEGQPPYLNAVVLLADGVDARTAFTAGQAAERAAGRERVLRWGPRTLDVDVVSADGAVDDPDLTVPHPRAAERPFVLLPWLDVEPRAMLAGRSVRELVAALDCSGVRPTELMLTGAG
ncbi:MAG: 2-amino-4-hydroxy-6-hydroxymethyldihydropteridine diphosphokinase [Frankiaceae bacterium]|nr:2-amino-4-hydroxy-6-hydroxymethyldihydropteridine diphosphokinase [Frankiaceae bacterium]